MGERWIKTSLSSLVYPDALAELWSFLATCLFSSDVGLAQRKVSLCLLAVSSSVAHLQHAQAQAVRSRSHRESWCRGMGSCPLEQNRRLLSIQ